MEQPATLDPQIAPLWRRWLALRVLTVNAISLALAFWLIEIVDHGSPDLPQWLDVLLVLPAVGAALALIANLVAGITDLAVHLVPTGRLRDTLLGGEESAREVAKRFGETGYLFALSPFFIVLGLLFVALIAAFLIGGVSALADIWQTMAGWPSWAVVITILLVLLLLKR